MTLDEFGSQMDIMITAYGDKVYTPVRCAMLYDEFKHVDLKTFAFVVSRLILEFRQPPLSKEFNLILDALKQQKNYVESDRLRDAIKQDSKDFWAGTYHSDEVKQIVSTIKRRLLNQCSDQEWALHMELLDKKNHSSGTGVCGQCDAGVIVATHRLNKSKYAFGCPHCAPDSNYPKWRDGRLAEFTLH